MSNDNTLLDWQNDRQFFIQNQSVVLTQKFVNARQISNKGLSLRHFGVLSKNVSITTDLYNYRFRDSFNLINENTDFLTARKTKYTPVISTFRT